MLLVDGVAAGVWHQRRRGRRTTVTIEPLGRLTSRQQREPAEQTEQAEQAEQTEQAERAGEVLEAKSESVVGEVTVGAHA